MDSPKSSPSSADSIFRSGESDIFGTRVLVGSSDFWAMRTEGGIFVDKSLFVKEFIESPSFYDVILRPRRFGKSLNLSMLGSFFSMYRKNASDLFRGLAIMEYENICNTHMGKYPVIELSMKQCIGKTWSMMKRSIARMMLRALTVFGEDVMNNIPGARMLVDCVMKDFKDGLNISDDGLWEMLGNLIRVLCKRDNSRVILLIDEYDAPLNVVFKDENDNEMRLDLFSNFYSFALKDNPSLWRACLVGIAEIQGAGTFSGLNNLQTYSINDEGFSEFFGFSEGEVMKVLTSPAVGMQGRDAYEYWSKSGGIRDWYNGYRIGKFLLINPWSFTCCISRGLKLRSYWARTAAVENLMDVLAERPSLARQVIEHSRLLLSAHARPIWFQDEQRLLWSTSVCTAGLRDRALIRVMVCTGGRVHDISLLHKQQHVEEKLDHAGEPAILVLINSIKNRRGDVCETWITGDAYWDVKGWIDRRKVIFPDSPFFL
jgi:hypothetical protein